MKIAWSKFGRDRHTKGKGYSYFTGSDNCLFALIHANWGHRVAGQGSENVDDVCVVAIPPVEFITTKIRVEDAENIIAKLTRRQPHESPYIKLEADGPTVPCKFAKVVLYSANELLKNDGERSSDADWEIVCIIASDVENEPMHPLAMARNQLEMPGGTPRSYTAEEYAQAIWYWSQFVSKRAE